MALCPLFVLASLDVLSCKDSVLTLIHAIYCLTWGRLHFMVDGRTIIHNQAVGKTCHCMETATVTQGRSLVLYLLPQGSIEFTQ